MRQVLKRITGTTDYADYQGTKKRSSSLNEWQVKVLWGIFSLAHQHPFSSAFQPRTSCFLLQPSPFLPFSLSSCPRASMVIFPFLSAFVRLSSRRSLRELCGELSLFYTATIKKSKGKVFNVKPIKYSWTQIYTDISKT